MTRDFPDTNAPTNALLALTDAYADAPTNAPTDDADARRTRPPTPPRAFVASSVASRAASGSALASRTQTRCRLRGPRVRMLLRSGFITSGSLLSITAIPTASRPTVSTGEGELNSVPQAASRVDIQQRGRLTVDRGGTPRLAARPVDSSAALDRDETAASSRTHQRGPQRVCRARSTRRPAARPQHGIDRTDAASRNGLARVKGKGRKLPMCFPARVLARVTRLILRVNAVRRSVCVHHREGFRARNASTPSTLVDTGRSHEARPARPLAKRLNLPNGADFPSNRPGQGVPGGKNSSRCVIRAVFPISRRLFPQLFAALCNNTGAHG